MINIIGFCGRCQGGKTELANICEEYGYQKISFATPLKTLVANLLGCDINEVNKLKTANFDFICTEDVCEYISKECEIPIDNVKYKLLGYIFHNTREMMQIIGTDIIRQYNNDWHINKMREIIKPNIRYVIDDVRFPNEANLIKELNGDLWFVVRPLFNNVSNHESENSLKWQSFDNIIINDGKLEYLKSKWKMFIENGYKNQIEKKRKLEKYIEENDNLIQDIISLKSDECLLYDALFINKYKYSYMPIITDMKNAFIKNEKLYAVLMDDTIIEINHPLEIEDAKIFL
ncbi:MAG: hypothetical protein IKT40_09450 [Bacilli bacterium]|nr:hypothetical protein [Bacilli bacterium]